jgi:hypothetical protein
MDDFIARNKHHATGRSVYDLAMHFGALLPRKGI